MIVREGHRVIKLWENKRNGRKMIGNRPVIRRIGRNISSKNTMSWQHGQSPAYISPRSHLGPDHECWTGRRSRGQRDTPPCPCHEHTGQYQNTCNNESKGLTRYSSLLNMKGVMERFWGEQCPVWVWTQTAAQLIPSWLTEPGIIREEVVQRSEKDMSRIGDVRDNRRGWW